MNVLKKEKLQIVQVYKPMNPNYLIKSQYGTVPFKKFLELEIKRISLVNPKRFIKIDTVGSKITLFANKLKFDPKKEKTGFVL